MQNAQLRNLRYARCVMPQARQAGKAHFQPNLTTRSNRRMGGLEHSGLASIRAYWLVAAFEHFGGVSRRPGPEGSWTDGAKGSDALVSSRPRPSRADSPSTGRFYLIISEPRRSFPVG
jgi:hypothetical protein